MLVAPTAANARKVDAALAEFGFTKLAADWAWFAKPYRVTILGRIPFRIDILTGISGVSFESAWKNRVTMRTDIGDLAVLGLADLRANKRAAGAQRICSTSRFSMRWSSHSEAAVDRRPALVVGDL